MLCSSREESLYRTQERDETLTTIAKKLGLDADCLLKRNKRRLLGLNGSSHFGSLTKVQRGTLVYFVEALDKFQGGSAASGGCDARAGAGDEGNQSILTEHLQMASALSLQNTHLSSPDQCMANEESVRSILACVCACTCVCACPKRMFLDRKSVV